MAHLPPLGDQTASTESSKPFSLTLGSANPKSVLPSKRPRAALTEDSDPEDEHPTKAEAVTGFEDGGAVIRDAEARTKSTKKEPLVIPVQKDADWRHPGNFRRRGKNLLPAEVRAQQQSGEHTEASEQQEEEGKPLYGLVIAERKKESGEGTTTPADANGEVEKPPKPQSIEEEAYARLVSGDEKKESHLVIPSADTDDANGWTARGEGDDFHADVASRPDMSTVADYEAVPIEDFGAAMLRGMGWKEGDVVGRSGGGNREIKPKTLERRPNLLGIGAKQVPEGLEELGAWGKGAKKQKGPRTREAYNPIVMRNSKTGEVLTEDELRQRQKEKEEQLHEIKKRDESRDWRDRRDRDRRDDRNDGRDRHRRGQADRRNYDDRDRDRDREYDRHRITGDDGERDRRRRDKDTSRRDRRETYERNDDERERKDRRRRDRDDGDEYKSRRRSRSPKRRSKSRDREKSRRHRYHEDGDRDDHRDSHRDRHRR